MSHSLTPTRAPSYVIPVCTACKNNLQHNEKGEWFCLKCADHWLVSQYGVKAGGLFSFRDVMPNRAARRRAARTR